MRTESTDSLIILTGAYPPGICGGGDYIYKLLKTKIANNWKLYHPTNWDLNSLFIKIREINSTNIKNINLQYPTMGYNGSIIPHLLCIYYSLFTKKLFSVTIHECSQLSFKAKIAEFLLLTFSNRVIFTNTFELKYAAKFIPFLTNKSKIIKIYTNIEHSKEIKKIESREYDLVNFGLIRPQKGLEEFIQVIKLLKKRNPNIKIILAGKIQPEFSEYSEKQINLATQYLDEVFYDKDEEEVAEILSKCKIAYLPFPDGISERRGSALAVLKSGGLIVTTRGKFTTKAFESCCELTNNTIDAVEIIENLLSQNELFFENKQLNNKLFLDTNFPVSWEEVASKYKEFLR